VWLLARRKRIDRKLEYALVAFVACSIVNIAIDEACSYVIPVDIAGTVPPDPRNAFLRALITAAVQVPVSVVLAYCIALRSTIRDGSRPPGRSGATAQDRASPSR
jgi:hypothetical protein